MIKFLLWLVLLVMCWPVALLALVLYPIVWILLLPFRIVGIAERQAKINGKFIDEVIVERQLCCDDLVPATAESRTARPS